MYNSRSRSRKTLYRKGLRTPVATNVEYNYTRGNAA